MIAEYKKLKIEFLNYMEGLSRNNHIVMDKVRLFLREAELLILQKEISILDDMKL